MTLGASTLSPHLVTLAHLHLSDQTVRGLSPSFDVWIPPPGGDIGEDAVFELQYLPSPLLRHPSSLTVRINDVVVWTVALDGTDDPSGPQSARMVVPKQLLRADFNHVQLQFLLRLPADNCQVQDHPGRYVTILNTSGMRFTPSGSPAARKAPDLIHFPAPFVRSGEPSAVPITVVVPTAARREHYTVAARVAARLGRASDRVGARLQLRAASAVTAQQLAAGHVVLIGTPAEHPLLSDVTAQLGISQRSRALGSAGTGARQRIMDESVPGDPAAADDGDGPWFPGGGLSGAPTAASDEDRLWYTDAGLLAQSQEGLVGVGPSPWNPSYAVLTITGSTPRSLAKAGQALAVRSIGGIVAGTLAVVPHFPALPAPLTTSDVGQLTVRLGDLGLRDRTLEGTGRHHTGVTFQAGTPDPTAPATLDLHFVQAPVFDRQRSTAIVKINDVHVGSVNLAEGETDHARYRMTIPAGLIEAGEDRLSVDFALYASPRGGCGPLTERGPLAEERAWVTLLAATALTIPQATTKQLPEQLDLAAYPAPFVQSRAITNVALLLPKPRAEQVGVLAVAADLGRHARLHAGGLQAGLADQFPAGELQNLHIVAFGTVPGNSTLVQVAQEAPVRLTEVARPIDAFGLIGLVRSPWHRERRLLYLSTAVAEALPATGRALARGPLAGTLVLVDREGRAVPGVLGAAPGTLVAAEQGVLLTVELAVGVGLLVLTLLGLHRHRWRRRTQPRGDRGGEQERHG